MKLSVVSRQMSVEFNQYNVDALDVTLEEKDARTLNVSND